MIGNKVGAHSENFIADSENGQLIRSLNWSNTSLGPIENWPQSLRTTVNTCLYSQSPVIVMWGEELIQLYNNACAEIFVNKHPQALGKSMENVWPELWHTVSPIVHSVLKEKKTLSLEDIMVFLDRKNFYEKRYFTFSFIPIFDESGNIAGLFIPVIDTTTENIRKRHAKTIADLLKNCSNKNSLNGIYGGLVETAEANREDLPFIIVYSLQKNGIEAIRTVISGINKDACEVPLIVDRRLETGWSSYINEVVNTNKAVTVNNINIGGADLSGRTETKVASNALFIPICKDAKSIPFAVLVIGQTSHLSTEDKPDLYKSIIDHIKGYIHNLILHSTERVKDQQLKSLFFQAPIAIASLSGSDHLVEMANEKMLALWGKPAAVMLNRPLFDSLGNSDAKELEKIFKKVYDTGKCLITPEKKVSLLRNGTLEEHFVKFIYEPIKEDITEDTTGILVIGHEVTEHVKARHIIEESEQQLRNLFMQAPAAIATLKGPDLIFESANTFYKLLVGKTAAELIGLPGRVALPELEDQKIWSLFDTVYLTGEPFIGNEFLIALNRLGNGKLDGGYFNFIIQPIKNKLGKVERLMVHAVEITSLVNARKSIEEIETSQKLAIEAAAIGTFDWNILSSEFKYSARLAAIFGYTRTANLTQQNFADHIHPHDQKIRKFAHESAFRDGKLFYEVRVLWPDGSTHWVRVNGKVVFDKDGKPSKLYGTALDITDQKAAAEELERKVEERTQLLMAKNEDLKRSEERYHKMIEEVHDYAIIMLDCDGYILNWNKGAEKIKGYSEEEIINKNFRLFYLPEDVAVQLPEKIISRAKEHGRAAHEGWRVRKDGTRFWGSIVITALHGEQNSVIGFSKVTRDLTERKLAEDKLKTYTQELELQNKELEQFAYVASHDLQEPLRKIQTFSDLIQNNLHNVETVKKYFAKIEASAKRMEELIKSVLNYSRLSQTKSELVDTDLNEILDDVLSDFELLIQEKKVEIINNTLPTVKGITLQLTQLFSNLIGNAIKFTDKDPKIIITSKTVASDQLNPQLNLPTGHDYHELSFKDNGIGFEQVYADRIFIIFQRLHSKQSYPGTGIGLALCKRIVDNHNGAITVKSEPGEGSEFIVYIPVV